MKKFIAISFSLVIIGLIGLIGINKAMPDIYDPVFEGIKAESIIAGVSTVFIYSGTTLTDEQMAGTIVYVMTPLSGNTPTIIGIPPISGSTGYFAVCDLTGGGVTVQMSNSETLYDDNEAGSAYFVNEGNSRHMATFQIVYESGSCEFGIVLGSIGSNWDME